MSAPKKEIYTYSAPWPVYSLAASHSQDPRLSHRYCFGSFVEEYSNKLQIIQLDDEKGEFVVRSTMDHPYPATRIQWAPEPLCATRDVLATSGDYLRLWAVSADGEARQECTLNNNKNNEYCAPVTSFDWSWTDPNQIATSSIDTTCTVWDITTRKVKTQLIAHDKEVFDIAWSLNKEIFATAGADGSLRLFDLRSLEHSTIMYETQPNAAGHAVPLLRIAWNRMDNFYIAAVSGDSSRTVIIDVRMPSQPYTELVGQVNPATGVSSGHMAPISAVTWAPHSACHMVTGADDSQALIWDLSQLPKPMEDPILAYTAESEINSLCWSPSAPDWVSISFASKVQILKV